MSEALGDMRSSAKGYVKTYGIGLIPFIWSWANQMINGASSPIEKAVACHQQWNGGKTMG